MMDSSKRPFHLGRFLAFSWVVLFLCALFFSLDLHTVGSWWERIKALGLYAAFEGSVRWFFLCLPATLTLYGLLRWWNVSSRWQFLGGFLPLLFLVGQSASSPSLSNREEYELRTGKSWPINAEFLSTSQFFDWSRSHIAWSFTGAPGDLEAVIKKGEWFQTEGTTFDQVV